MPTLARNPTSNAVVVTGWSNPTYAYNEDGVQLATAAPGKATYITSDFSGFDFSGLPDGAKINSLTVLIHAKGSVASSNLSILFQPWSGGAAIGSEFTQAAPAVSLSDYSSTWILTAAQIKSADFKIRLRGYRAGNTAYTASVDYIRVTVDYSTNQTFSDTLGLGRSQAVALANTAQMGAGVEVSQTHTLTLEGAAVIEETLYGD